MLIVEDLVKEYDGVQVLKKVSFKVDESEIAVLVGPNGSGKTTLLNIVAGLVPADEGLVSINGEVVFEKRNGVVRKYIPPEKRRVGYVPQDYALFPHLTVYDNIAFGLKKLRLSKSDINARVRELVEIFGLKGLENKYPHQLSGGQKQKVALARALAPWPKLVLLDEPLSAIDPGVKDSLRLELKYILRKLSVTALIVTHDLNDAWTISDKVFVLMNGEIKAHGTPANILGTIRDCDVARFLGVNIVEGIIIEDLGDNVLVDIGGSQLLVEKTVGKRYRRGDRVKLVFRPDDVIVTKCGNDKRVLKCSIKSYRFTKCSVKLTLGVNDNSIVVEVGRGYINELYGNIADNKTLCVKILNPYIVS